MKFQITATVDVEVREDKICPQKALQLLSYATKLQKQKTKIKNPLSVPLGGGAGFLEMTVITELCQHKLGLFQLSVLELLSPPPSVSASTLESWPISDHCPWELLHTRLLVHALYQTIVRFMAAFRKGLLDELHG